MRRAGILTVLIIYSFFLKAQESPTAMLAKLGLQLPVPSQPKANFVKWVRTGNLIYTSGHGPTRASGALITGKLGSTLSIEEGYEAAQVTGLQLLATLQAALGDLNKVKRIVKVFGLVNCEPQFGDQPKVMNGFSDLMVSVFGEKGKHARSAIGTNALPSNMAVEIEMIVEVED